MRRPLVLVCIGAMIITYAATTASAHSREAKKTGWCPKIAYERTDVLRVWVHDMGCPTMTRMLRRYLGTGRYPSGYTCAADIILCWSKDGDLPRDASHWFRAHRVR